MKKIGLVLVAVLVLAFVMPSPVFTCDKEKREKLVEYALKKGVVQETGNGIRVAKIEKIEKLEGGAERKLLFGVFFSVTSEKVVLMKCDSIEELWTPAEKDDRPVLIVKLKAAGDGPIYGDFLDGTPEVFLDREIAEEADGGTLLDEQSKFVDGTDEWHRKWYDSFINEMFQEISKLPKGLDL